MRRIYYIRNASDEELIKFLEEFDIEDVDNEWCNKHCPHIVVANGEKIDCTGVEAEDCPFAASDHHDEIKTWLEEEML